MLYPAQSHGVSAWLAINTLKNGLAFGGAGFLKMLRKMKLNPWLTP